MKSMYLKTLIAKIQNGARFPRGTKARKMFMGNKNSKQKHKNGRHLRHMLVIDQMPEIQNKQHGWTIHRRIR